MSAPRVGIIGGGIVGPVVATFLKLRGYDPVIYERRPAVLERGIGIGSVIRILSLVCLISTPRGFP